MATTSHWRSRIPIGVWLTTILAAAACSPSPPDPSPTTSSVAKRQTAKPNIVLIVTDDQRWDSLDQLPFISQRDDWARFDNAFVNDPQCCPSRATILSGRDTRHTKVETLLDGKLFDETETIATMLNDAGYRTGLVGKYLNNYPFGRGPRVPPGWDDWHVFFGGSEYFEYKLNDNARVHRRGNTPADYSTDVITRKAMQFLSSTPRTQPFFLEIAFFAPHRTGAGPPTPAPRDEGICGSMQVDHRDNYNERDTAGRVPWMSETKPVAEAVIERETKATCEALRAVDENIESLFRNLEKTGRLDDTYVIFTSDNGYSLGEHQLLGKGHLYDEAIRVPLLVRGPDVVPHATEVLTSNTDFAPTIADWAGIEVPGTTFDGRSFAPEASGKEGGGHEEILLRGCRTERRRNSPEPGAEESGRGGGPCGGYLEGMGLNWGLRTDRYKLVENSDGSVQLFDLENDPYELHNMADDRDYRAVLADLSRRLNAAKHR